MRRYLTAALVATLALSGSALAFAGQAPRTAKPIATHAPAEKSTSGTVKSIDATTLVLKTKGGEKKFSLDPTVKKDGVAAGSHVMVRYKIDGKSMVATSVMIEAAPAAKK